jgi:hypothetical protein
VFNKNLLTDDWKMAGCFFPSFQHSLRRYPWLLTSPRPPSLCLSFISLPLVPFTTPFFPSAGCYLHFHPTTLLSFLCSPCKFSASICTLHHLLLAATTYLWWLNAAGLSSQSEHLSKVLSQDKTTPTLLELIF